MALTSAAVAGWARTLGIRIATTPIMPGRVFCHRAGRFESCDVGGRIGRDYVDVEATSIHKGGNAHGLPRGTQILVVDIGHFQRRA
jgi:hypothetical protein